MLLNNPMDRRKSIDVMPEAEIVAATKTAQWQQREQGFYAAGIERSDKTQ